MARRHAVQALLRAADCAGGNSAPSATPRAVGAAAARRRGSSTASRPRDAGAALFGRGPDLGLGAVPPAHTGRFYQRRLPAAQVPFASREGKRLFQEALLAGTLENYFYLAEQFRTQDEPTFCGLATLAMVLNSLRIDPMRTWKGAWRWFNEQNLGCCAGADEVRESGLSFDMFNSLAGCNGADSIAHRAPAPDAATEAAMGAFTEAFRATVRAISRSQERECIVVCYSREVLGQSGAGHFSPVGGYHEESDSVLIMDVARFKYPPHWARVDDIARAMANVDPDTGRPRGYLHLRLRRQDSDDRGLPVPLTIPYVPVASGKRLSEALAAALDQPCARLAEGEAGANATVAVRRWLHAVVTAEPRVLSQLLQIGDEAALREVITRLKAMRLFSELCDAYAELRASPGASWLGGDFPPLRLLRPEATEDPPTAEPEPWLPASPGGPPEGEGTAAFCGLGPKGCGELWVLLLLLLPEHLRAGVSKDLAGPGVARDIAKAVKGPWALPLEALRAALAQMLPPPKAKRCL